MRLLILGGTRFVGRHLAEAALRDGWSVTLFNRGLSDPAAFPQAEHRVGNRDGDLSALRDGSWDVVVDTCGYVPRVVRASAGLLAGRVGLYVFISSASVYADKSVEGLTEDAQLAGLDDAETDDVETHYDGLKAACEREVAGGLIVRPGLIVGPHDPTNRFTRWVRWIAAGGEVDAPEPRTQPVQVIDARDLADWLLRMAAAGAAGNYNAVGDVSTMEHVLRTIVQVTGVGARLRWQPEEHFLQAGLEPWTDVPLWLAPESDPSYRGFLAMSNARAKAAGLELRPLEDTVRDILAHEAGG